MKSFNLVVLRNSNARQLMDAIDNQLPGLPPEKSDMLFREIMLFQEDSEYAFSKKWAVDLGYLTVVISETTETKTEYEYIVHNTNIEEVIMILPKTKDKSVRMPQCTRDRIVSRTHTNVENTPLQKPEPPPLQYVKESYNLFKSDDR